MKLVRVFQEIDKKTIPIMTSIHFSIDERSFSVSEPIEKLDKSVSSEGPLEEMEHEKEKEEPMQRKTLGGFEEHSSFGRVPSSIFIRSQRESRSNERTKKLIGTLLFLEFLLAFIGSGFSLFGLTTRFPQKEKTWESSLVFSFWICWTMTSLFGIANHEKIVESKKELETFRNLQVLPMLFGVSAAVFAQKGTLGMTSWLVLALFGFGGFIFLLNRFSISTKESEYIYVESNKIERESNTLFSLGD